MSNSTNAENRSLNLWSMFRTLSTVQQVACIVTVCFIPIIVFALTKPAGIFWINQHLYYLNGMYEAGVDYLQNDPDASMRPTHVVFSKLIYLLQSMDILAVGSQFFSIVLHAMLGLSFVILGVGISIAWRQRQNRIIRLNDILAGISIAAVFGILLNQTILTHLQTMAMAKLSLTSFYFQASDFGILTLLGIAFLSIRFWRLATISFIIASIFHSNYFVLSAPLMLVLLYENYRLKSLRKGLILCAIFAGINLPLLILGPMQWSQANSAEAIRYLNEIRSPHHYDVHMWWDSVELGRMLIMGIATIFAIWKLNSVIRNIMILYFGYILSGTLIVALTNNQTIASLLPWRASGFILPVGELIIIGIVILILFEIGLKKYHTPILVVLSVIIVYRAFSLAPWDLPSAYRDYTSPEIEMVRNHTQTNDVILIPPRLDDSFRVYAQRPIFVMWKSTGYYVDDWIHRVEIADEMMEATLDRQAELCADYQFAYYLLPATAPAASEVVSIDRTENYLLVGCPDNISQQQDQAMLWWSES